VSSSLREEEKIVSPLKKAVFSSSNYRLRSAVLLVEKDNPAQASFIR